MRLLPFVIAIGFLLSAYALFVEHKFSESQRLGLSYRPMCDIGAFSCTKVFSSEYGYLSQFLPGMPKISNAIMGMLYYALELLFETRPKVLFALSSLGLFASFGLFYVLTILLNDLCIVCTSIYVVNIITFVVATRRVFGKRSKQLKKK